MSKYCSNCGSELKENADVCLGCGRLINRQNYYNINNQDYNYFPNNYYKPKVPGKGMSIAGMILGIVAVFWAFMSLISIEEVNNSISYYYDASEIIGYIIGYTLFSLTPSIVGLCLSICGYKKQKNGLNITGIILNIITLAIVVIEIVYILTSI